LAVRYLPQGCLFDATGLSAFCGHNDVWFILAVANSSVSSYLAPVLNPTLHFKAGDFKRLPVPKYDEELSGLAKRAVNISRSDWDFNEFSMDFSINPVVAQAGGSLSVSYEMYEDAVRVESELISKIEAEIDSKVIYLFGLSDESVVQDRKVKAEMNRSDAAIAFISYCTGCMMGRYSLDEPGLIYAHAGNVGFDASLYATFPADADGIIPITDESWFEDDAAERVREFVKVIWGGDTLVENMEWLADSVGRKAGESADEAIRRYLSTSFYKDHLQTYKKRPIYWLFSSGKQKAFECLVYLHRYNEGTLSRMRMEYVVPLQSRMQARIDKLTDDIDSATSSAQQKALQKRKDKLTKQLEELRRFDENLRPYADQRITLDLDDGVKVNYGKFGNLLAEVKTITGGKEE